MVLEFASKDQLLQIALFEKCEIAIKYAAVRELQERYLPEEIRADILYRLGVGTTIEQVAKENAITPLQVVNFLRNMHSKGKHADSWKKGYNRTIKACGRKVDII